MPKPKRKDWTPLEVSVLRQVKSQKKVPWKTKQEIFRERIDNLYHGMSQRPPTRTVQAMMTKIRRVRSKSFCFSNANVKRADLLEREGFERTTGERRSRSKTTVFHNGLIKPFRVS